MTDDDHDADRIAAITPGDALWALPPVPGDDGTDRAAAGVDAAAAGEGARHLAWFAGPVLDDVAAGVATDGARAQDPDADRAAGRDDDPYRDLFGGGAPDRGV